MNKLWAYVLIVLALIAFIKWYSDNQYDAGWNAYKAKAADQIKKAVESARKEEQTKQGEVNEAIQKQFNDLNDINSQLNVDINGLRDRPSRADLPDNARTNCKGASGSELAREYAEFLTRYSAKTAKQDAALSACYSYADTVAAKR